MRKARRWDFPPKLNSWGKHHGKLCTPLDCCQVKPSCGAVSGLEQNGGSHLGLWRGRCSSASGWSHSLDWHCNSNWSFPREANGHCQPPSCGMWVSIDPLVHLHPLWVPWIDEWVPKFVLQFVVLRLTRRHLHAGADPSLLLGENPVIFTHAVQDICWV